MAAAATQRTTSHPPPTSEPAMSSAIPTRTVIAKPAIDLNDAWPRRQTSTYSARWSRRTTVYATANKTAPAPYACGSASAVMKMSTVASSSTARTAPEFGSSAFAVQTNADHAHHMSAITRKARPKPGQVRSRTSSVLIWVTAKTKTRSQSSSTFDVRRAGIAAAGAPASAAGKKRKDGSSQLGPDVHVVMRDTGQDGETVLRHAGPIPVCIVLAAAEQLEERGGV